MQKKYRDNIWQVNVNLHATLKQILHCYRRPETQKNKVRAT
jgi:hypothetical protein